MPRLLFITEGARAEPKFIGQLLAAYSLDESYEVYSYETNIHELYGLVFAGGEGDDIDLLGALRERERARGSQDKVKLLSEDYTDIVMVFDYDPQDDRFDPEHLVEMMGHFNESTDAGKLYLNYPMLESYKDIAALPDIGFLKREIPLGLASIYKECVGKRSRWPSPQQYSREEFDWVISHNLAKAFSMLGMAYTAWDWREFYQDVDNARLLIHENQALAEGDRIPVLCTCVFFICDNWPDMIGARDISISRDSVGTSSNPRRAEHGNDRVANVGVSGKPSAKGI